MNLYHLDEKMLLKNILLKKSKATDKTVLSWRFWRNVYLLWVEL